jgi:hypothetical protein
MIAGTTICSDNCGTLPPATTISKTLTGTWTATATGPVTLEFNNWRGDAANLNVQNFVDNLCVKPQNANFATDLLHISCSTGGLCNFTLDAGPTFPNQSYVIFSGVTGSYPGFTLNDIDVPLNLDVWTFTAFGLINTPIMMNFMAALDGSGQGSATFFAPGSLPPEAVGLPMYFAYILLQSPGGTPAVFASHPMYILFVP